MFIRTVIVHKVVRIGKTATGANRFRFYTDAGSINSKSDAQYFRRENTDLDILERLEGKSVNFRMMGTVIFEIV